MKNLTFVFILFLLNIVLSSKVALEYKLQQKNGKNFLVINTDGENKKRKTHKKKKSNRKRRKLKTKVYKKKKNSKKRKLSFVTELGDNAVWTLKNLGAGAVAGAVAGKVHKSHFLKKKLKFQRDLNQIKMKTEVQKENLADLFKVKLALKRALSKLKAYKSDLVFRLRAKEDDIVELLGELQV